MDLYLQGVTKISRIRDLLKHVFTSEEAIETWLDTRDKSLGDQTPRSLLATEPGKVETLVKVMIQGVPL